MKLCLGAEGLKLSRLLLRAVEMPSQFKKLSGMDLDRCSGGRLDMMVVGK